MFSWIPNAYQISLYRRGFASRRDVSSKEYSRQHDAVFFAGISGRRVCRNPGDQSSRSMYRHLSAGSTITATMLQSPMDFERKSRLAQAGDGQTSNLTGESCTIARRAIQRFRFLPCGQCNRKRDRRGPGWCRSAGSARWSRNCCHVRWYLPHGQRSENIACFHVSALMQECR